MINFTRPDKQRFTLAFGAAAAIATSCIGLDARSAVLAFGLGAAMLTIALIDARRFIIPDALSLPAIPCGLLASGSMFRGHGAALVDFDHVAGMVLGFGSLLLVRIGFRALRGRQGLGLGDVKLAGAAGAWVGWQNFHFVLLISATTALCFVACRSAFKGEQPTFRTRIPFGAFLAPAIWITWRLLVAGAS